MLFLQSQAFTMGEIAIPIAPIESRDVSTNHDQIDEKNRRIAELEQVLEECKSGHEKIVESLSATNVSQLSTIDTQEQGLETMRQELTTKNTELENALSKQNHLQAQLLVSQRTIQGHEQVITSRKHVDLANERLELRTKRQQGEIEALSKRSADLEAQVQTLQGSLVDAESEALAKLRALEFQKSEASERLRAEILAAERRSEMLLKRESELLTTTKTLEGRLAEAHAQISELTSHADPQATLSREEGNLEAHLELPRPMGIKLDVNGVTEMDCAFVVAGAGAGQLGTLFATYRAPISSKANVDKICQAVATMSKSKEMTNHRLMELQGRIKNVDDCSVEDLNRWLSEMSTRNGWSLERLPMLKRRAVPGNIPGVARSKLRRFPLKTTWLNNDMTRPQLNSDMAHADYELFAAVNPITAFDVNLTDEQAEA